VIEQTTLFDGAFLKKVREYKNVELIRMADMTKVSKTYLRHIEEENTEGLPALVYVRGFVYQYAKCLKLNPDQVATSYLGHLKSAAEVEA
jgi:cytoskeletal protein RodZ